MTNKEIVEEYVEKRKNQLKKFLLIQFVFDIIEITAFVLVLLKVMDNNNAVIILVAAAVIIMQAVIMINIKLCFGSLKNFKNGIVEKEYDRAKAELLKAEKANEKGKTDAAQYLSAQRKFEETIDILAEKIKNNP